jgi:hypothetical protein
MDEQDDPILKLWGLGKEIWADTDADEYVRGLRANWYGDRLDPAASTSSEFTDE